MRQTKLRSLALNARHQGNLSDSDRMFKQSLTIARENGDRHGEASLLYNLAINARHRGDLSDSDRMFKQSLIIRREIGDKKGEARTLNNLSD